MRFAAPLAAALAAAAFATPVVAAPGAGSNEHASLSFPAAGQLRVDAVTVRTAPRPAAPAIEVMHQFRRDYRLQEVLATGTRLGADGKQWFRISVPMRPNGKTGWIPATSVTLAPTTNQIVVHRASRTIDVFSHGKRRLHAAVAIGAPGMETPLGHYYVQARFVPDDPFLGVFAVETSAYSKLSEWPGGGVVGIHGTSMPQLLGQAVSHGCVRVSNATAAALRRLAPLGTPIWITN